jgi:hypothetical protein
MPCLSTPCLSTPCLSTPCLSTPCLSTPCLSGLTAAARQNPAGFWILSPAGVRSLKRTLPDKSARILIYCNNNFRVDGIDAAAPAGWLPDAPGTPAALAFRPKTPIASLNLSTYELGPQLDPSTTKLPLVPTSPKR